MPICAASELCECLCFLDNEIVFVRNERISIQTHYVNCSLEERKKKRKQEELHVHIHTYKWQETPYTHPLMECMAHFIGIQWKEKFHILRAHLMHVNGFIAISCRKRIK